MKKLIVAVLLIVPFIGNSQCVGDCNNGKGAYKFPSGDKYVGEWVDRKLEGQGTYTFSNGDKYVGEWVDNKFEGQGTFTYSNGDKYVGEYKEGLSNGYGVLTIVSSKKKKKDNFIYFTKYEGNWEDGKKHGYGTAYYTDGSEWIGNWIEDEQAEVEKKNNDNIYNSDDIIGDYNYTVINLEESEPNSFYLNINIDGVSKDFVFDTGCTDFTFDKPFLNKLIKNGCEIKKTNIKGSKAQVANGDWVDLDIVILNNVEIGDYILNNVVASVGGKGNSFLCGIGLFNKFSNVEWNMKNGTLTIYK